MKRLFSVLFLLVLLACQQTGNNKKETTAPPAAKDFERVLPPVFMKDVTEQANFLVNHYWDHFNFKDTMYVHAPNIMKPAFLQFISIFQYASPNKISEGVAKLMKSAEADSVMFMYFRQEAELVLYEPNSPYRNDEYYIPFLEQIVNTSILDDTHKIRPRYVLNLALKNRPGNKAADIQYTTANGRQENLYGVKSEYLLLMFYNPGCSECKNTMGMIQNSAEISPLVKNGTIKVVVVYPDENIDKWKEYIKEIPSNWVNGYDKSLKIREEEIYDVKAIPTLYLLDKDKKVILKDCSIDNINQFLKVNP
ncbi:MAG: DUF5106 domain-containing protein [Tannerella sp.]|jgi:thioredoxin-related protein|nr:DUF5106 domain-containing protein [Tannerella sp.]